MQLVITNRLAKKRLLSTPVDDILEWNLFVELETLDEKYKDYSLFLTLDSYETNEVRVHLTLAMKYSKCQRTYKWHPHTRKIVEREEFCRFNYKESELGPFVFMGPQLHFDNYQNGCQLGAHWRNDDFKIFCGVSVDYVDIKVPACKLSDDFSQLFEDEEFSDVIISVAGCEFKVHKAILSARSPVFAAMFKNAMKESKTGIIKIYDVSQCAMKELLRFMYTGKVLNIDKICDDLLI